MADEWEGLHESYVNTGLTLVLGAGVSVASGIPNWEQLVQRLLQHTDMPCKGQSYTQLRGQGFSPTTITQYVKQKMSEKDYIMAIKEALYRDFPCRDVIYTWTKQGADQISGHIRAENRTLRAVYDLATTPVGDFLEPNRRVPAIINFNLDSLLESYDTASCCILKDQTKDRCLHKIESAASRRIVDRTSVYHPHGYLRFENRTEYQGRESRSAVLSEYEYYDFYNQPTKLFTYTFLSALRETSCLFIGMSMTDDNVRRLLFYSKQEIDAARSMLGEKPDQRPRHFAILQRRGSAGEEFLEQTLLGLSVKPQWVDDVDEIPARLRKLRSVA